MLTCLACAWTHHCVEVAESEASFLAAVGDGLTVLLNLLQQLAHDLRVRGGVLCRSTVLDKCFDLSAAREQKESSVRC